MKTMLEKLKEKFALLSKEEILKAWNSGDEWDNCGPKAKDYLINIYIHVDSGIGKPNLENLKINDNLGSNSYSNLFFYHQF